MKRDTITIKYVLEDSWLSAFIGTIDFTHEKKSYLAMLNPKNIYKIMVIRNPTRTHKMEDLTEEVENIGIDIAIEKLKSGIKLSNVPSSLVIFKKSKLFLEDNEYYIETKDGKYTSWINIKRLVYHIPAVDRNFEKISSKDLSVCTPVSASFYKNAILLSNSYMDLTLSLDRKYIDKIDTLLEDYDIMVWLRFLNFMTYDSSFRLPPLNREGKSKDQTPIDIDLLVNEIIHKLCIIIFPIISVGRSRFDVNYDPVWWKIQKYIKKVIMLEYHISSWESYGLYGMNNSYWITGDDPREPKDFQTNVLNEMIESYNEGELSHLMWITTGMGKTYISMEYIKYLVSLNTMPHYCIWTTPSSAIDNLTTELDTSNIIYVILDSNNVESIQNMYGRVLIVEHDVLRSIVDYIIENVHSLFLIVDEVHKMFNPTKRTSAALRLANLSTGFILMTGTIITNDNSDGLIRWLKLVSPFKVDYNNYLIAFGYIYSRHIDTDVEIENIEIDTLMEVPISMTTKEFRTHINDCYVSITRTMVKYIIKHIDDGVFVVCRNKDHITKIYNKLIERGVGSERIGIMTRKKQYTLDFNYNGPIDIILTRTQLSEGYTLTSLGTMITSVYFTNLATRKQLKARINRLGQERESINIITIYCGILKYIHKRYQEVESFSDILEVMKSYDMIKE